MINIGIRRTSSHETSHTRMSEICEFQVHYNFVNIYGKKQYLLKYISEIGNVDTYLYFLYIYLPTT